MSFSENRLELGIDYGTVGGFRCSTTVIVDGAGNEQRNANWLQPLGRWQIGDRTLNQEDLNYFLDFHSARKGAAEGFRFRDWADYEALSQLIGTGDGTTSEFQLIKSYSIGAYTAIRAITKPVGDTVRVYFDGVELSDWWVDVTTGIITFAVAPEYGVEIAADFEFDVPVRFEQDKIDFRFDAYADDEGIVDVVFHLSSLVLLEVRLSPALPIFFDSIPARIDATLDLGFDYGTVGGPAYSTTITGVGAGYERRESNWEQSRGRWQIGDRTLRRSQLDYLISFFRTVRGAGAGFTYKDWASNREVPVRFEQDSIEFRFDAYDSELKEVIFYLAGLPVVELLPVEEEVIDNPI